MKFLAPLAMLALCGFLLVFGSQQLLERELRLSELVSTQARVTGVETRRPHPTSREAYDWVLVSFQDQAGAEIETGYQHGLPVLLPGAGDLVPIFYDPDNALSVQGGGFITMWGAYIVGVLIILLFGWMGLGLLWQDVRSLFRAAR